MHHTFSLLFRSFMFATESVWSVFHAIFGFWTLSFVMFSYLFFRISLIFDFYQLLRFTALLSWMFENTFTCVLVLGFFVNFAMLVSILSEKFDFDRLIFVLVLKLVLDTKMKNVPKLFVAFISILRITVLCLNFWLAV